VRTPRHPAIRCAFSRLISVLDSIDPSCARLAHRLGQRARACVHVAPGRRDAGVWGVSWMVELHPLVERRRSPRAARPSRPTFFTAAVSRSSSAATRALDSMYRTLVRAAMGRAGRAAATFRADRRRGALRFATIGVDELRGGTRRQADVGPVLERVSSLYRRMENARGNQLVPSTSGGLARGQFWRHELRDNAPMSGHGNPLSRFDSPNISAQVVLQLANAGLHVASIATCATSATVEGGRSGAAFTAVRRGLPNRWSG
jgi:hypothetical protein